MVSTVGKGSDNPCTPPGTVHLSALGQWGNTRILCGCNPLLVILLCREVGLDDCQRFLPTSTILRCPAISFPTFLLTSHNGKWSQKSSTVERDLINPQWIRPNFFVVVAVLRKWSLAFSLCVSVFLRWEKSDELCGHAKSSPTWERRRRSLYLVQNQKWAIKHFTKWAGKHLLLSSVDTFSAWLISEIWFCVVLLQIHAPWEACVPLAEH